MQRLRSVSPWLVLSLAELGLIGGCLPLRAESALLERLAGRDLRAASISVDDVAEFSRMTGLLPKGFMWHPVPWRVWRTLGPHPVQYVALHVESESMVPGGSSACVQTFDEAGKRLHSRSFQTGWRMTPESALLEFSRDTVSELVVLQMSQFLNGRDVVRQYYALDGQSIRLVRLESSNGKAMPAEFVFPNVEIGPPPTATTTEEWLALLDSRERSEVLAALTFLGGRHVESRPVRGSEAMRSRYADMFLQLMSDPRIRERLEQHARSSEPWIREAAVLALHPPTGRELD